MREFYSQFGSITDIIVMRDPTTKRSRGFGFVTFTTKTEVDEAMKQRPHVIDGKTVDPKRAVPRDDKNRSESNVSTKRLYVSGIREDHTEDMLSDYFSKFGVVTKSEIILDKATQKPRGFGFVTFDDHDSVDQCVLQKSHMVNGHRCDVRKGLSKDEMSKAQMNRDRETRGGRSRDGQRGGYNGGAGGWGGPAQRGGPGGWGGPGGQGGYGGGSVSKLPIYFLNTFVFQIMAAGEVSKDKVVGEELLNSKEDGVDSSSKEAGEVHNNNKEAGEDLNSKVDGADNKADREAGDSNPELSSGPMLKEETETTNSFPTSSVTEKSNVFEHLCSLSVPIFFSVISSSKILYLPVIHYYHRFYQQFNFIIYYLLRMNAEFELNFMFLNKSIFFVILTVWTHANALTKIRSESVQSWQESLEWLSQDVR